MCWHCRLHQCCHLLGCNFLLFVTLRAAGQIFRSGWCSEDRHSFEHLLVEEVLLSDNSQLLLDMRPSERPCQSIVCSVRYTALTCVDQLLQHTSLEAADQTPLEWVVLMVLVDHHTTATSWLATWIPSNIWIGEELTPLEELSPWEIFCLLFLGCFISDQSATLPELPSEEGIQQGGMIIYIKYKLGNAGERVEGWSLIRGCSVLTGGEALKDDA